LREPGRHIEEKVKGELYIGAPTGLVELDMGGGGRAL